MPGHRKSTLTYMSKLIINHEHACKYYSNKFRLVKFSKKIGDVDCNGAVTSNTEL